MGSAPATVAVIGAGTIGSGWAALFASRGAVVRIVDPDPGAVHRAQQALACARALAPGADSGARGRIESSPGLDHALREVEWVQESLPESLTIKRGLFVGLADHLDRRATVASSTSTFTPSELSGGLQFSERFVVAHPLHPVYAVPVVELCAGPDASRATIGRAAEVMRSLGREPVLVRGELPGLVANRLTAALLREALDLVSRGIVSPAELDRIVARGVATGWATVGPLETEALGSGSMEQFLERSTSTLARLWESLAAWHVLDDDRRAALMHAFAVRSGTAADGASGDECGWAHTLAQLLIAARPKR